MVINKDFVIQTLLFLVNNGSNVLCKYIDGKIVKHKACVKITQLILTHYHKML